MTLFGQLNHFEENLLIEVLKHDSRIRYAFEKYSNQIQKFLTGFENIESNSEKKLTPIIYKILENKVGYMVFKR